MKKSIFKKAAVISLLGIASLSVIPPQSQALIGLAIGNIPLIVIGGVSTLGSLGYDLIDSAVQPWGAASGAAFLTSLFGGGIGIVLLRANGQATPQFAQLSVEQAKALGVSSDEMSAYNSELPQINALYQTILSDTLKQNQSGTSLKALSTFSDQEWSKYEQQSLSSGARAVLEKVRSSMAQKINQAVSQLHKQS